MNYHCQDVPHDDQKEKMKSGRAFDRALLPQASRFCGAAQSRHDAGLARAALACSTRIAAAARVFRSAGRRARSSRASSCSNTTTCPGSRKLGEPDQRAAKSSFVRRAARAPTRVNVVELNGWVNRRRDHGGLIFVDLRDRDGVTQVVFDPQHPSFPRSRTPAHEDVLRVRGSGAPRARPAPRTRNLPTGEVEVGVDALEVLNRSQVPPFQVNVDGRRRREPAAEYRYLDLRRPRMQRNIRLRHRIVKAMRDFFDARGFVEIETPMLIKIDAGRRARLSGAQPRSSGHVLRACRNRRRCSSRS